MKVLILADINSIHTKRWVKSLSTKGVTIALFGFSPSIDDYYKDIDIGIFSSRKAKSSDSFLSKFSYLFSLFRLKKVYKSFKPDIVHAHYATSYGLLGRLLNKKPFLISVWGSDIYDFPNRNRFFRKLLEKNLNKADVISSSSHCMAKETKIYTNTNVEVIPFGVNSDKLISDENKTKNNKFIIGTIKTLDDIYGIDILIRAFKIFVDNNKDLDTELHIYGDGPEYKKYNRLCYELSIKNKVFFYGRIENKIISQAFNTFDIFAALSRQESFGVVVVEAMSCKRTVVVSNVGGLPEVVDNEANGLVVESEDYNQAAKAFQRLYDNADLRKQFAEEARKKVEKEYKWEENVDTMISVYKRFE